MTPAVLLDAFCDGLRRAIEAIELEQAPHGLDSWSELALHEVLAAAIVDAGLFVAREQRYPGARQKRQKTSGQRCDLVVTAGGPLVKEQSTVELFAPPPLEAQRAAWIEVKVLKQFGASGPNHGWERSLVRPPVKDVARLANDADLGLRGLLLVLFTASRDVALHDLQVWRDHVVEQGFSLRAPCWRHLPLVDRRGNAVCTAALFVVDCAGGPA
jgi:hypothetical protein